MTKDFDIDITVKNGFIYVKSKYCQELVDFMRSRPQRRWIPNTKEWVLPESDMSILQEFLSCDGTVKRQTTYDVVYENAKEQEKRAIPEWYQFKNKPYQHQIDGIEYGLAHPKFLLADEQGLGKTFQSIHLSQILKKENDFKHILVITCVNSLKYNWQLEIEEHSNEKSFILGTRYNSKGKPVIKSNEERLADVKSIGNNPTIDECLYIITNIETLRYSKVEQIECKSSKNGQKKFKKLTRYPIVEALQEQIKKGNISMIIADEVHKCKDSSSQQGTALLSLETPYKVALTGTPIMNKPTDIYTVIRWLGFENHSYYQFENHYCIKGAFRQIVGYKNLPELQSVIDKCMIRRKKDEVLDLPEKVYINEFVEMDSAQRKIYNDVLEQTLDDIDKVKNITNKLAMLARLRQVTDNPNIISSTVKKSAKYDRMVELVDEVVANGEKCIIFSNWTDVINPAFEILQKAKYNPALYTGQNTKDREDEKDRFMNDDSCKVLLGTIGAMGTGLTLTAATTVIFLDEPWTRATKDQCEDRLHRIGTKKTVNIITLMCKGTIDEKINSIVYKKGKMSDILIDKEEDIFKNPKLINYLLS